MNNQKTVSVFNRSGLAALSDLQTEVCKNIFSVLEEKQTEFLSKASEFRSEEYKWPNDPLHTWSRIWEYPYVYYHLNRYVENLAKGSQPVVADVGSGVTFFPFSLAQLGYEVICTDIDPICEKDILRARESVSYLPGNVNFRLINNKRLPFEDGECDVLYCISVLEHIPDFENTVREMARILKPGGELFLTFDLDLRGDHEIGIEKYYKMKSELHKRFQYIHPVHTVHPTDMLISTKGPYGYKIYTGIGRLAFLIKQHILKPLLGRKPEVMVPYDLAVEGVAMEKKDRQVN